MKVLLVITGFVFCIDGIRASKDILEKLTHLNISDFELESEIEYLTRKAGLFIIDGHQVQQGDLPFMVSIQQKNEHFCGGSIIDRYTILTAAHCLYRRNTNNIQVLAGVVNLGDVGQRRRIVGSSVKIHPKFREIVYFYDIAIFKVDWPFIFNDYVNSVELEDYSDFHYTRKGNIAGWGYTKEYDHTFNSLLQEADVIIMSDNECRDYVGDDVDSGIICSLPYSYHEDACQLDSGGPLLHGSKLCGIISSGNGCGGNDSPGIYTKIIYFIDWIRKNK